MSEIRCRYAGQCSGCAWIGRPLNEQMAAKRRLIAEIADPERIRWIDCGHQGLRDRADFTWEEDKLGLYELVGQRPLLDLENCPMLSPKLSQWFEIFRSKKPPIRRGSVRLRVSPSGQRGVWLDFANVDVKNLFEERTYLKWLSENAIVEIGQRRKRLHWVEGVPKLKDPELFPWFETYSADGKRIPLYGTIGGFTQSGFAGNRALVNEVLRQATQANANEWTELFAGSGNFSLALAGSGLSVHAYEFDRLAIEAFERSKDESGLNVSVTRADLYNQGALENTKGGWLIDPPRSGLGRTIEAIDVHKPQMLIYVSCWTESFLADAKKLKALGYGLVEIAAVDQFVNSPHVEWVGRFSFPCK